MAFTFVIPMTWQAERLLGENGALVQAIVREALLATWKDEQGVPIEAGDIITPILRNPVLVPDTHAERLMVSPDVLILVNTSDQKYRGCVDEFKQVLIRLWNQSLVGKLKAEIWADFFFSWAITS